MAAFALSIFRNDLAENVNRGVSRRLVWKYSCTFKFDLFFDEAFWQTMDDSITPILSAVIIAVAGVFAWIIFQSSGKGLSNVSGWKTLADKYPVTTEFDGVWRENQSATFKNLTFNDCLDIGVTTEHLYITVGPPFKNFEPLQIPLNEIQEAQKKGLWLSMRIDGKPLIIKYDAMPDNAREKIMFHAHANG